jgi:hypothetical protein
MQVNKLTFILLICGLLIGYAIQLYVYSPKTAPSVKEKIVYKDRIVYKDKIIYKNFNHGDKINAGHVCHASIPIMRQTHQVYVHGGYGPLGKFSIQNDNGRIRIRESMGFVGGIGYGYRLTDHFSVLGTIYSNKLITIGIKCDF